MAIIITYPISASGIIVLLKTTKKYYYIFADFILQEQAERDLMAAISKPIKTLEFYYPVIPSKAPPFIFAAAHAFCASWDDSTKSGFLTAVPAKTEIFLRCSQEKQIFARVY